MSKNNNIFNSSGCLSLNTIKKYLNNELSPKKMHGVEKHMLECKLCEEAVEGYLLIKNKAGAEDIISSINKTISTKENIFDYRKIAASIAAVVILGAGLFYLNEQIDNNRQVVVKTSPSNDTSDGSEKKSNSISIEDKTIAVEDNLKKTNSGYVREDVVQSDGVVSEKPKPMISPKGSESTLHNQDANRIISPSIIADSIFQESESSIANGAYPSVSKPMKEEGGIINESKQVEKKQKALNNSVSKRSDFSSAEASKDEAKIRGESKVESEDSSLKRAITYYNEKKYKEAVILLDKIIETEPFNFEAFYYNGLSYYGLGQWKIAITNFDKIDPKSSYFQDASWYKANAFINIGEKEKAKVILKTLSESEGPYKKRAEDKLKKL
jgi:hypothetical protein